MKQILLCFIWDRDYASKNFFKCFMVIIKKIIEVRKKEKCVESLNFKLHLFSEFFLIDVLETFKKEQRAISSSWALYLIWHGKNGISICKCLTFTNADGWNNKSTVFDYFSPAIFTMSDHLTVKAQVDETDIALFYLRPWL